MLSPGEDKDRGRRVSLTGHSKLLVSVFTRENVVSWEQDWMVRKGGRLRCGAACVRDAEMVRGRGPLGRIGAKLNVDFRKRRFGYETVGDTVVRDRSGFRRGRRVLLHSNRRWCYYLLLSIVV